METPSASSSETPTSPKLKESLVKKIIVAGLAGAVTLFFWSFVSHEPLDWHDSYHLRFKNEEAVKAVIEKESPEAGIYMLPNPVVEGKSAEEVQALLEDAEEQRKTGISLFAAVGIRNGKSMIESLGFQFLGSLVCSLIISLLLCCQGQKTFLQRILFVEMAALFAFVGFMLPSWNWYSFSGTYMVVNLFDTLLGWGLAGAVIALVFKRSEAG